MRTTMAEVCLVVSVSFECHPGCAYFNWSAGFPLSHVDFPPFNYPDRYKKQLRSSPLNNTLYSFSSEQLPFQ